MDSKLPSKPLEVPKKIDDIKDNDNMLPDGNSSDTDSSASAQLDLQIASVKAAKAASASAHDAVDHHDDGDDEIQVVQPPTTTKRGRHGASQKDP